MGGMLATTQSFDKFTSATQTLKYGFETKRELIF